MFDKLMAWLRRRREQDERPTWQEQRQKRQFDTWSETLAEVERVQHMAAGKHRAARGR